MPREFTHCLSVFLLFLFSCQSRQYEKLGDGIVLRLLQKAASGVQTARLQVVSKHIFRVTASPADTFSRARSLMVVEKQKPSVAWEVKETPDQLTLHTAALRAMVSFHTGEVTFTDSTGHPILRGVTGGKPLTIHQRAVIETCA